MKELCVGCGLQYEYNPSDPRGATSIHCPSCQKKESRKKKRYDLLKLAGNGEVRCRCCGYSRFAYAINLHCVKDYLISTPTDEEKARASFLVCNNCKAAIDSGDIKFTVRNSNSYPIDVGFYETNVTVTEKEMPQFIHKKSDAVEMEVVDESEEQGQSRSVSRASKRLGGSKTIDV